ncbi:hypothetical protein B6S44_06810 [Bosea sp. Tri-44]|uniref:hypothetical protein n=1 Tax=Bosea sp. Tri-44 TaxID=1972137 RepID=UPI00100EE0C6|nr:hypothetical protein [Bosea sp. Tri-44]RXT55804.1 hypothetical protein B6S44_06810 [Bosea sp. Tri-44]
MSSAGDPDKADPMRRLRTLAEISTARACGFAGLATFCLMVGLSGSPPAALKAGGYCALLVVVVLLMLAQQAPLRPYKRTEIWLMLDQAERPPEAYAQGVFARVRRDTFLRFAAYHAMAATILLAAAFLIR